MENINRGVDDAFYRYKMPKLLAKIEGNGNGIKTVIPNMKEIAKSLGRPPEITTKFFGFELGSQTIMDDKTGRYIVNGAHDAKKLAELLDVFIKKFVLCSACSNPETDILLKKGKGKEMDVYLSCKACGKVAMADNVHKLASYIAKNPPPGATSGKKDKKGGEKGTPKKKTSSDEENGVEDEVSGDLDEITTGIVDLTAKDSGSGSAVTTAEDPAETLAKYISAGDRTGDEIALEASKLDLALDLAAAVMVQVLLESNLVAQFKKHKDLFKNFVKSEKEQKGILGGLERLVAVTQPELLPKTSQILRLFYDADIVEEAVILAWYDKPTKKFTNDKNLSIKVRESAKTLVEWLKNAEEESDDE